MNNVFIYKNDDYNHLDETINSIVENFKVLKNIKRGTKVVIKANLVSALAPDKNATTNYKLLASLTNYLLENGCSVVVGDSPGGLFNKKHLDNIYKITKVNLTKAKLNDNYEVKNAIFSNAKVLKTFEYTAYLDDADIKINFCKLKTHAMMLMSSAVKNLFGCIPGLLKTEYHYRYSNHKDFANMLIDLNEYFKFDINIVDAIYGMEGNGPTNGVSKKIGVVLASTNPYALDYICAKIINLNPFDVLTISESKKRGLFNEKQINLNLSIDDLIVKDFKNINHVSDIKFYNNSLIGGFVKKVFENKPYCYKNKCIGCKKCANICPQKAISMVNNKPKIDRNKCIKCYCCQEFCPVNAMRVKSSLLNRIINNKIKK